MTESKEETKKGDVEDDLEPLLMELLENKDVLLSMMNVVKRLREAGIINLFDSISRDYMPTDVEFLGKFFTSKEFTYAFLKTANTLISVMHAMSNEKTSDMVKAIMFDAEGLSDSMISGAKNPQQMSMLKLYSTIKDPDIASGLTAVLNALKVIGQSLRKVGED